MPNLQQLYNLKKRYGSPYNPNLKKEQAEILVEAFDPEKIEKGFKNVELNLINKNFSFSDSNANGYIEYFLQRKRANVVLLFIDITGFSKKFTNKGSDDLMIYLDDYYSQVIPLIGKYGGEIEKIMGDGIICVFGEPFLQKDTLTLHTLANNCARNIISELFNTDYEVKIALHFGEIMYYKNPCDSYYEYTMIGNAITEIFRLESISKANSISFFSETIFHKIQQHNVYSTQRKSINGLLSTPIEWTLKFGGECNLQGVEAHQSFRYTEYIG